LTAGGERGREGEEELKEVVWIALTSFQFAVACTFAWLLTASAQLSTLPLRSALPECGERGELVVELFIRFCRELHFLNLQFLVAPLCRLHAAVPCAFTRIYSLHFLYLFFIYFLINLMRQFCASRCALHTFRGRLHFDCVHRKSTRKRKRTQCN